MAALDGIETTLRAWGVPTITSWIVAPASGSFAPTHVMVHHTVSDPAQGPAPSREVVREGTGVPPPLCQILVRRDLKVELITRGKANHAGTGGPWGGIPQDAGNARCIGIEIEHAGTSAEPWTAEYMAFCRLVAAACLDFLNEPASHLLAHKEWAPDRKIDPYGWAMGSERTKVAALLAAGPNPAPAPEVTMSLPAVMVASGQTQAYYVDGNVKRKIVSGTVANYLTDTLDLPEYTGVPSAVLSLWPTVATDAAGVGQDAATQALAQLGGIATQLAALAASTADAATAAQVTSLAAQVAAVAVAVSDDATSAEVDAVLEAVEALQPAPPVGP